MESSPTWVLGYTILWGGWIAIGSLLVFSNHSSLKIVAATSFFGAVGIIALGFGVYRRDRWAAWGLVAYAATDVAARAAHGRGGEILPGILLALALIAAISLWREAKHLATQN